MLYTGTGNNEGPFREDRVSAAVSGKYYVGLSSLLSRWQWQARDKYEKDQLSKHKY